MCVVCTAVMCEGHREYRACGPACRPSCRTLSGFYVDTETTHEATFCKEAMCVEGCFCPPGTVEGRTYNSQFVLISPAVKKNKAR